MIKIAFHDNCLCVRGTTTCIFNFAYWGREYLGFEPIIMYNKTHPANDQEGYDKCSKEFQVFGYNDNSEIDQILKKQKCDYFFMKKGGSPDGVISKECINLINACSGHWKSNWIHGDIYAMGSEWLSKLTGYTIPYVSDIVVLPNIETDIREEIGIPKNALVFGRNGGYETFDIHWVKQCILSALEKRNDIWFLFQNTEKFLNHNRVIHLPKSSCETTKVKFINTCDAMIHARQVGESFGVACAEFSLRNKPVITYNASPESSHIDILGKKGIYYSNPNDLMQIFLNLNKKEINSLEWNQYKQFAPEIIIKKFKQIYLK
jgi:hypothetical protein